MSSPEQEQPPPDHEAEAVAAIAGYLAVSGGVAAGAATAEVTAAAIVDLLMSAGVSRPVARHMVAWNAEFPSTPAIPLSPAVSKVAQQGPTYRAQYLWNAAKRVGKAVVSPTDSMGDQLEKERRYFTQHRTAQNIRRRAAIAVDGAANAHGDVLGWYAVLDEKTTPECRDANGKNFLLYSPPAIGFPGLLHAGNCRCTPGAPHATDKMVGGAQLTSVELSEQTRTVDGKFSLSAAQTKAAGLSATDRARLMQRLKTRDERIISNLVAGRALELAAWDESAHPRGGTGTAAGGKFVAKDGGDTSPEATSARLAAMSPEEMAAALATMSTVDVQALGAYLAGKPGPVADAVRQNLSFITAGTMKDLKKKGGKGGKAGGGGAKSKSKSSGSGSSGKSGSKSKPGGSSKSGGSSKTSKGSSSTSGTGSSAKKKAAALSKKQQAQLTAKLNAKKAASAKTKGKKSYQATDMATGREYTVELSAKTAGYSVTHHKLGPGPLWHTPGLELPAYIQNVAKGLMESGHERSEAIRMAVGICKRWARGGGNVTPEVRAAAAKAIAEWEAAKVKAHSMASDNEGIELARSSTKLDTASRAGYADTGVALPDGSFPIRNGADLDNAVHLVGHAKDPKKAMRHIIRRARALGLTARLPDKWKTTEHSAPFGDAVELAATEHTGGMIALVPDAAGVKNLVVKNAEPADQLHLTLAFLGDVTGWTAAQKAALVKVGRGIASRVAGPITARAFSHTTFNADGGPKGDMEPCAVYGIGDTPRISPLRDVVLKTIDKMELPEIPAQHEPFVPHVTAGYNMAAGDLKFLGPVTFDRLAVVMGGVWTVIPLGNKHDELSVNGDNAAIELASRQVGRSRQHISGTMYNWKHGYIPLNVQTALLHKKSSWAKKLHASGAPFAAPESRSFHTSHPAYPKIVSANNKLNNLSPRAKDTVPARSKPDAKVKAAASKPVVGRAAPAPKKSYNTPGEATTAAAAVAKRGLTVHVVKNQQDQFQLTAKTPTGPHATVHKSGELTFTDRGGKRTSIHADTHALVQEGKAAHTLRVGAGPAALPAGKDFTKIRDVNVNEPPLPTVGPRETVSTGLLVTEPDGSVWTYDPKGSFGGYQTTFSKGQLEPGLTGQQNAHKELSEELGLEAKVTGFLGDYKGSGGVTRMYMAVRTGGTPLADDPSRYREGGAEHAQIRKLSPAAAAAALNAPRDRQILHDALTYNGATSPLAGQPHPISTKGWKKVGAQSGSNKGGVYEAPDGSRHYVKQSKSDTHAKNEVLAAALYKAAGVDSASQHLTRGGDGKLGTHSPLIPGATSDLKSKNAVPAYRAKVQEGFATDAWLGNWDVVGLNHDNIVSDKAGNPVRVDPGGALLFRAQGAPKMDKFGDSVGEWDTLRNGTNPQSKSVFGGMTDTQLKASAQKVVDVSPAQIDAAIKESGFDGPTGELLSKRLKARRADIAQKAGLTLPENQQEPLSKFGGGGLLVPSRPGKAAIDESAPDPMAQFTKKLDRNVAAKVPTALSVPAVEGKRNKKGKLVVQAPAGEHKVGDKIAVKSPAGNLHTFEVTHAGGEFPKGGITQQYFYGNAVKGDTPKPATPAAPEVPAQRTGPPKTTTHKYFTAATVNAQIQSKEGSPKFVQKGSDDQWHITDTAPASGSYYEANPGGYEYRPSKAPAPPLPAQLRKVSPRVPKAKKFTSAVEAKDHAQAQAHRTGETHYMQTDHATATHKVTSEIPLGRSVGYKSVDDNGSLNYAHNDDDAGKKAANDLAKNRSDAMNQPWYVYNTGSGKVVATNRAPDKLAVKYEGGQMASQLHNPDVAKVSHGGPPGDKFTGKAKEVANGDPLYSGGAVESHPTEDMDPVDRNTLAWQKAVQTGKTQYAYLNNHGDSDMHVISEEAPPRGAFMVHYEFSPNGDVYKVTGATGKNRVHATKEAILNNYDSLAANGPKKTSPSGKSFHTLARANLHAKTKAAATGTPHFVQGNKETQKFDVSTTQPKGLSKQVNPDGTTSLADTEFGPLNATTSKPAVVKKVKPGSEFPPEITTKEHAIQAAKNGKLISSAKSGGMSQKKAAAFQKAVKSGNTHYIGGYDGTVSKDKPAYGSYTEFHPDGTANNVSASGAVSRVDEAHMTHIVAAYAGPKAAPGAKLEKPPAPAKKGLGPVQKELYNLPDIPHDESSSMSVKKSAALQKSVKTGTRWYLKNEYNASPQQEKPEGGSYWEYHSDGSSYRVYTYSGGGVTKYTTKPASIKYDLKSAKYSSGLSLDKGTSAPSVVPNVDSESGVLHPSLGTGDKKAFSGTVAGEYITTAKPTLPGWSAVGSKQKSTAKLTPHEDNAAYKYTGSYSGVVNSPLRKGKELDYEAKAIVSAMDTAMAKHTTDDAIVVRRGMGGTHFPQDDLTGKVYQDSGFGSTSFGTGFSGPIRWTILVPKGSHGISTSAVTNGYGGNGGAHPSEKEFILPRGTQYFVEKDVKIGGTRYLTAVVVPATTHSPKTPEAPTKKHIGVVDVTGTKEEMLGAYTAAGRLYLKEHGRKAWLEKYAGARALTLSKEMPNARKRLVYAAARRRLEARERIPGTNLARLRRRPQDHR